MAYSTCSRSKVFFFATKIEWGWEHNYPLDGLNQWITQLGSNWHQIRAEDNEKNKQQGSENCFLTGRFTLFSPTTRRIREETSSQAAKVRTILPARPGSRKYQAAALSGHYYRELWKQQEMKSINYSGLAQSYASLPIATRALIPTLRIRKLHCQRQQTWSSSLMKQRFYLAASCWAKASEEEEEENIRPKETGNKRCLHNQRKYVQNTQRSQGVEYARRQLCQVIATENSESNKKWNQSSIQGWLNPTPHCPSPLELWFQLSALESWHGQM